MEKINRKVLVPAIIISVTILVIILMCVLDKPETEIPDHSSSANMMSSTKGVATTSTSVSSPPPSRILFATTGRGIQAFSPLTSEVQTVISSTTSFRGLARDPVNRQIYFSADWEIYRANEDGTAINAVFQAPHYGIIYGLALDVLAGNLYGVNLNGYVIVCKTVTVGTLNCTNFLTNQGGLYGIAVNPNDRTIYWTQERPAQILRASMDGDGADRAVVVAGLQHPTGIFIDQGSSRLFWADYIAHKIQSSNLDGGDVRDVLHLPEGTHPFGIVLYGNRIYWGTWDSKLLQSCNKSGQDVRTLYSGTAILQMALIN